MGPKRGRGAGTVGTTGRPAAPSGRRTAPAAPAVRKPDSDDDAGSAPEDDAGDGEEDYDLDNLEDDVDRWAPAERTRGRSKTEDDDDDSEDEQVEVFGLDMSSDDGDDDDDEDGPQLSDSDVELATPKQRELSDKAWGRKRQVFYDADGIAADEDAQREEEEEAERLQRRRLKSLTAADYGLDEQVVAPAAAPAKKTKTKSAPRADPLAALASSSGEAAPAVERVARDLSRLSSDEARALVTEDAPELLGLLADLQTRMQELETHLGPLLARIDTGELRASQGLSLLHVKHQLLLSYCTNLCFYFYLKASGERVADHPVIAALVEQRALLEKLRPMEVRLKYQIDRLVQAATTGVGAGATAKPNPSRLAPLHGQGEGEDDEADDDARRGATQDAAEAKFRPSRLAPMPFDPDTGGRKKAARAEERLRDRAARSRLLRDLQEEFTDAPVEISDAAPEQSRVAAKLAEREAFEEEHFTRLPTTRADRALKRQRLAATLEDELDALRDYTDLADYTAAVAKKERTAATASAVGSKRNAPEADTRDDDEGADVDEEAAAYYRQVERAQERKRQDREAAVAERRQAAAAAAAAKDDDDDDDDDGGAGAKRGATTAMLKNKGLTAKRKKEQRNPRVRRRMQYEKAKKKLASTGVRVAVTGGARAVYGGESTGIKRNLARSVTLK